MADGFEYILGLKDDMGGPAKQAKAALAGLKGELVDVDARVKMLDRANKLYSLNSKAFGDQIKKNRAELVQLKVRSGDLKDGIKALDPPTKAAAGGIKELAAAGGIWGAVAAKGIDILEGLKDKIVDVVKATAELVAEFVIEGGKWAIEAGAAREKAEATYTLFAGTAAKGKEIFDKIDALGTAIHVPTEKAHEYARDLLASGVEGTNRLEQTVKSIAMLQKVGGDAASAKIKGIIEEAAKTQKTLPWKGGRGMFSVTREDLVGTGVSVDEVYGALAKRLKKSNAEVRSLMLSGQISAADGIDALNDVLERGKVGDAARKMVGDLTQPFTEIKDNIGKLLRDVDYKGFLKELGGIPRLFDPATESGKVMKTVLTNVFNTIFDTGKTMVRGLKIAFLELGIAGLTLLIRFAPLIKSFKEQWERMKDNTLVALAFKASLDLLYQAGVALMFAFEGIGRQLVVVMTYLNMIDDQVKAVWGVLSSAFDFASKFDMKTQGLKLMQDLATGLTGGAGLVTAAGAAIGDQLKQGFRDAIGWHSPPQFFLQGGKESADAFAKGSEDMGAAAGGMAKQIPSFGGGVGGGVSIQAPITIQIDGAQSPKAVVDEFEARANAWLQKIAMDLIGGEGVET